MSQTGQPNQIGQPGQSSAPSGSSSIPPPGSTELHTAARLVVVDVVVEGKDGHPVRNLPRSAFQVTENKTPQTATSFEEHSGAGPIAPSRQLPPLPPGTFTDYTPVPPSGALNILLIDALNTPMQDQSYLRNQLQQYVNKAQPGMQVAIFGLNTRLYLLQGFTSNLDTLKDAVNHKLIPRASNLLDDPASGGAADTSMSDSAAEAGMASVASNLQQFEAVQQSFQLKLRAQYTLDAFNALAHYLSGFPGRKNILWFSGSFPIDVYPDASLNDPFSVMQLNDEEFRQTTNLLTHADVAVYPIDARGLMVNPAFSAANAGHQYARNPSAFGAAVGKFNNDQAQEHLTMEQMAEDTGGRAYYNTNGLASAAANALEAGSNYYTLSYSPTDRNPHGEYRSIHVALSEPQEAAGLKLFYRHGYYADDPKRRGPVPESALTTTMPSPAASAAAARAAYARSAMFRGAPTPEDILFKVRVLPVTGKPEDALAPGNEPDPKGPVKGPFLRYAVDYAAVPSDFRFTQQANGNRTDTIEFTTFVYDTDGKLLNTSGRTVQVNLTPEAYKRFVSGGVGLRLEISAPARGESFLRIAVHDVPSNRYGVVEIATSSVRKLAPAPPQSAPAPSASGPPEPQPQPQGRPPAVVPVPSTTEPH